MDFTISWQAADMCKYCYIDGRTGTRLYNMWRGIKKRRNAPNNPKYGGRAIRMCAEREGFPTNRSWAMSGGYTDQLTIERKYDEGNFTADNCSWITKAQQARNRRTTRHITIGAETRSLAEWCDRQRLLYARVRARIHKLG